MSHRGGKRNSKRVACLTYLLICGIVFGVSSATSGQKVSVERWNPTRVPPGMTLVGDKICAECHKSKAASQSQSSMGIAMESIRDSKILTENPKMTFRNGPYSYEITRKGDQSFYTVTDGKETISLPILFAFGQGKAGQTYLLQNDGAYYESLVSFYNEIKGLDFTIGAPRDVPASLLGAVGRRLSKNETLSCFGCHSTGGVSGSNLHIDKLTLGVRCEACHGPGGAHVAAGKAGEPNAKLIFNPARLGGDELTQDFCAACHRGAGEFATLKGMGVNNVRFQPYRIFNSKCYSDDRRISCAACHDPHESLKEDAAYYDTKCLACHAAGGKPAPAAATPDAQASAPQCRAGTKNCASCHMPKMELPGAHFKFTDHYIRVVRPNEPYQP
jgi:hypothetical protein